MDIIDSILIFPPGPSVAGSQLQIGTYLMYDPGADYGAAGLIQSIESSNALRDGGVFGYRNTGPRKMSFPLLLRDVPGQTLLQTESLLRRWTTAGAAVAVQPENVASGEAVFFDVIDGRWEPDYDGFENRIGRRRGTLFLDTQPWGYWPTEMLLASAASQGFMGQLAVQGASLVGDVPPLAHLQINPTGASVFLSRQASAAKMPIDMVGVSFGAIPSFNPLIPPAVFGSPGAFIWGGSVGGKFQGTIAGDVYAPASQSLVWGLSAGVVSGSAGIWQLVAFSGSAISSALEPAYRGRFRMFSFWKVLPASNVFPVFQTMVDVERAAFSGVGAGFPLDARMQALASGNQLATIGIATDSLNVFSVPSNAYQILDQGEITLPPQASGVQGPLRFRIWLSGTSGAVGTNIPTVSFGGLYLLPVDGAAGILTRGGAQPSLAGWNASQQTQFEFNAGGRESQLAVAPGLVPAGSQAAVVADVSQFYRGVAPRIGASTSQLTFITADRVPAFAGGIPAGVPLSNQVWQGNVEFSTVSVSYRPTFAFLHGL